jgi:amino acid permease
MRRAFIVQGSSLSDLPYVAPGFPYFAIFSVVACAILALLGGWSSFSPADPIGLVGNYAGLVVAFLAFVITKLWTKSKLVRLCDMDLDTGRSDPVVDDFENEKVAWWKKLVSLII